LTHSPLWLAAGRQILIAPAVDLTLAESWCRTEARAGLLRERQPADGATAPFVQSIGIALWRRTAGPEVRARDDDRTRLVSPVHQPVRRRVQHAIR